MSDRRREVESIALAAFAAAPLYLTRAIGILPLVAFHAALLVIMLRIARDGSSQLFPPFVMKALAFIALPLYLIDMFAVSRGAFGASAHLILFVSVYQASEALQVRNREQRLLTTALLFIASIATSTHLTIILFVIAFAFLLFRELMHISHAETASAIAQEYHEAPANRTAWFYLAGTTLIGILLFPILPRVRDPWVQGVTGGLTSATTGLSDTIDFNQPRDTPEDTSIVARIWMGREAVPFFTPLRLRGTVYDRFAGNVWLQTHTGRRHVLPRRGHFRIADPMGFTRGARVQQRMLKGTRLLLPVGTYSVQGVSEVWQGPTNGAYSTARLPRSLQNFQVSMALNVRPLRGERIRVTNYPVTPEIAAMARSIVGTSADTIPQAARIESYLARNFQYLKNAEDVDDVMTVDDFLLRVRKGHCEYFAAGMVALMTSLNVPARIVGGFYGGRLNPLTGYFVVRREDAHAWVEVWDGEKWATFDPTPTTLRPGIAQSGFVGMYASAISDSINFFWDRYVLTYGLADQIALAAEVIGRMRDALASGRIRAITLREQIFSPEVFGALALIAAACGAALVLLRRRRSAFDLLARHLATLGIEVGPAMTMEEALERLRRTRPEAARSLEPLIVLYEEERFSSVSDRKRVAEIRRRLAEMAGGA